MNDHGMRAMEYRPVASLTPAKRNARTHSRKQIRQIADSIERFGFTNPVLIDDAGGIVAGHGRVAAARLVGLSTVPVVLLANLTAKERQAYAERWDETSDTYLGLAIEQAANAAVVIDSDSVIVRPDVAEAHRPAPPQTSSGGAAGGAYDKPPGMAEPPSAGPAPPPLAEKKPTRFTGAVMISPDRPARDMHQIVEAIVEQLTTLPGSQVKLRLEIEAEVPSGLDRAKVRTLVENANTLGFIEKSVE